MRIASGFSISALTAVCQNNRMPISLEIPDKLYSKLKKRARAKGISMDEFIVRSVRLVIGQKKSRKQRKPPIIESDRPGSLQLDNATISELIDFP
jgi:hypothetical protein